MKQNFYDDEKGSDLILQGQLKKNSGTFGLTWQTRYAKLYPNRLELYYENKDRDPEVYTMERIESIESKEVKGQKTISIHLRNGNEPRLILSPQVINRLFFFIYSFFLFNIISYCKLLV
jgi:beta-adrenergic-receptor kinase